jgi:hypothetical protein
MYNTVKMIGELNECLFRLRKPLADFLCIVLPPLFKNDKFRKEKFKSDKSIEKFIFEELEKNLYFNRIIKQSNIKTIQDLDISLLLNILLNYYNRLRDFYNSMPKQEYLQYYGKFNDVYLTKCILEHRSVIAHPNDKTVNVEVMRNVTDDFIKFGNFIGVNREVLRSFELIKNKYSKYQYDTAEEKDKNERVKFIEDNVLRNALNHEELDDEIKNSILTTLIRFKNKKTSKEIDDFFIGAQDISPRGKEVRDALRAKNLMAFEDIREEYETKFLR